MTGTRVFDVESAREVLAHTPATLRAMLSGLSPGWIEGVTRQGSWRAMDVVGHLIQGDEEDWIPRARMILDHGEGKQFKSFDRSGLKRATAGKTLPILLDQFEQLRAHNLEALDAMQLDEGMLDAKGLHPELGPVTLREMLATWAAHDLSHIGQIADSMARRYRDDVGPWRRFLPVLDRPEESSD